MRIKKYAIYYFPFSGRGEVEVTDTEYIALAKYSGTYTLQIHDYNNKLVLRYIPTSLHPYILTSLHH